MRPIARAALVFDRPPRCIERRYWRGSGHGDAIAAGDSHLWGAARSAHGEDRFKDVAANFSSPPLSRRSTRGSMVALVCLRIRAMGPSSGDASGIRKERDQPDPPFPYWLILPTSSPKVTAASAEHYDQQDDDDDRC